MPTKKFKRQIDILLRIMIVLTICGVIVFLFPKVGNFQYEFQKGMPWRYETLKAPFDFPIYKTETELKEDRHGISNDQIPIFNLNGSVKSNQLKKFTEYTDKFQNDNTRKTFELIKLELSDIYDRGIIQLPENLDPENLVSIKIVESNIGRNVDFKELYTLKKGYSQLNHLIESLNLSKLTRENLLSLNLSNFLQPNLEFDAIKTNIDLNNQLKSISLTQGMIQKDEIVIAKRELVTPEKVKILNSLKTEYQHNLGSGNAGLKIIGGQVILALMALISFSIFLYTTRKRLFFNMKDFIFLYGMFLCTIILGSIGYYQNINLMALPVLFFIIIVNILFDSRPALYLLLGTTLLISYFAPNNYMFLFMQIVAGIVAIFSLSQLQRRGQLFLAIFLIFITYVLVYVAFILIQEGEIGLTHLFAIFWLFINCLLLSLTYPVLYIFERLFGYTSEITLMELSNPNHPALRNLTKRAPGTFQHSLIVANLAEEAIYRIGGSPLLTRTGALYHDIGKAYEPIFFIENQSGGENPHAKCDFEESALHIIDHVTRGVELANKHHLPEAIINFIRTHHGKSKVKYFYNSFRNQFPDREINENSFTYIGPDPVSKECSVVMMADAVEAASRTLQIKNEENIKKLVSDIIDAQVNDGRFQNADITFKDIAVVKRVYTEMLVNIYHSRIVYPKLEQKEPE